MHSLDCLADKQPMNRSLQYKRQDKVGKGDSERIQSVLCEDALRVKGIIVV